ncbi:hypothetical protein DFP93_12112 [Aneurinibacillus soli]|uniref:Uncharacterized protein n=2 Tax=Aneurinibacillus soli TaxID=1500254 RepID=A0A0U5C4I4_9BACL|nr:hypothetical protein [Aneurinibacillus soli]PYE58762.1 hypothetical protein DFP93_12112 [Aneurinibacillus soli]BAU26627.1 hypothetical protein CB4_00768 [Aneurinibacillus soli]
MMHKKWIGSMSALLLASCMLAGCSSNTAEPNKSPTQQAPAQTDTTSKPPAAAAAPDAPQTKQSTLTIEGSAQPITLKRYDASMPLPFHTYYPQDMIAEKKGDGVQFTANFAGTRNDDMFIKVEFPADLSSEQAAVARIKKNKDVTEEAAEKNHTWTKKEFNIDSTKNGTAYGGSALIGEHNGHYFIVTVYMPVEAAEGLGVRADKILEEWVWTDDHKPLIQK